MPSSATERPTIRAVRAGGGPVIRDVCVQMLLDAPEAFNATLAEVEGRSQSEWVLLVERCARGTDMSAFLAEDGSGICGFVRADATYPGVPPDTVVVSQLWAAPRRRGMGLGRELMNAVTKWAEDRHGPKIVWPPASLWAWLNRTLKPKSSMNALVMRTLEFGFPYHRTPQCRWS